MDSLPAVVRSLPVRIIPSFKHPVLAWSSAGMTDIHVAYNPRVAEKLPPEVLAFALVHEYAHLQFGHIDFLSPGTKPAAVVRQQELDADRFAARFWATNDAAVARAAAASFVSPDANRVLGSEKPSLKTGYPTRIERAQAILDTLAETQRMSAAQNP